MILEEDIDSLINAAALAGFNVKRSQISLHILPAGINTHLANRLPHLCAAIYIFKDNDIYLKVGKAGENSNPRFQSQHYTITRTRKSGLAISLSKNMVYAQVIAEQEIGGWIKRNTTRFNVIFPAQLGKHFLHFAEAFFILKCNPLFEG